MVQGLNISIIESTNYGKFMTFEKKKMIPHFMWNFSLKIALSRCIVRKSMKELRTILLINLMFIAIINVNISKIGKISLKSSLNFISRKESIEIAI